MFKTQIESLKKHWPFYLAGAVGVAGLVIAFRRFRVKKNSRVLRCLPETLYVKRKFAEREYNPEEKVFLKDKEVLVQKLSKLKAEGADHLQIIVDFDQTITSFEYNQKPCTSCFDMFRTSSFASPEYTARAQANVLKYMPIERDPFMPYQEKMKHMEDWWKSAENLIAELNLDHQKLSQVLEEANVAVRYGFKHFAEVCQLTRLPMYIVSGGILDFIKPILSQFIDLKDQEIRLFGNVMHINEKGCFEAFALPHINSLHKEKILSKQNTEAKFRKNAILLGDSINDRLMTKNLDLDLVIAIGFLDTKRKDHLEHYLEAYDIVIVGDGNFTQVEMLMRHILGLPQREGLKELVQGLDSPLKNLLKAE